MTDFGDGTVLTALDVGATPAVLRVPSTPQSLVLSALLPGPSGAALTPFMDYLVSVAFENVVALGPYSNASIVRTLSQGLHDAHQT